ncbi:MAG: phosphate/phosphite/phosphonate ABC transporter substrate-binding protein [Myxococcota bacterium]
MSGTRLRLVAIAVAMALLSACREQAKESVPTEPAKPEPVVSVELPVRPLRFGRPPHLTAATARQEYTPLADFLGRAIDHEIVVVVPGSYDQVVDMLVRGELDMALLTPFTYVKAKRRLPSLVLIASMVAEGAVKYRGYIVTKANGEIHSVDALKGKRFAFVDKGSASGYLFPHVALLEAGIDPRRDFAEVRFAGGHPKVVQWVLDGTVDAGAISSTTFRHLRGEALFSRLEIIAKTAWIPFDAVVLHPSVPEPVARKLQTTLMGLNSQSPEGRAVLTGITTTNGFIAGNDATYDPVRRVAAQLESKGTGAFDRK